MRFKAFFEAHLQNIEKIKDAIDNVEARPFKELFGDKDRFLIKVYNPEFSKATRTIQVNPKTINWEKRTISDKNIPLSTYIKTKLEEVENSKQTVDEIINDIYHL